MQVELSPSDTKLLHQLLLNQLHKIEDELVHTDKRDLQREVAADAARLRGLIERLGFKD